MHELLDRNFKLYCTCAGGGFGAAESLWKIPGCSSFLTGFSFPYAPNQTIKILGYTPSSFVSEAISLDLAAHSFMEAFKNRDNDDQEIIGIGATSSVASIKEHRGDHRSFVSLIGTNGIFSSSLLLPKGSGQIQRETDGDLVDRMIKTILLNSLDLNAAEEQKPLYALKDRWAYRLVQNSEVEDHLFSRPFFKADGTRGDETLLPSHLFYPGHYNPFHWGHEWISKAAEKELGREVVFSTTINPPHKTPLTPQEMLKRVAQMEGRNFLLTRNDATFLEKAQKFPGSIFVVGMDTLDRLLDEKWGHSIPEMLVEFGSLGTEFFVVDRKEGDHVLTLGDVMKKRKDLFEQFHRGPKIHYLDQHWDISSTELRNKKS